MKNAIKLILDYLLVIPATIIPHHFLSRQVHKIARIENEVFKHYLIKLFRKFYPINLSEANREDIREYDSFNDFFTRSLKEEARPLGKSELISPVDGLVSQFGAIKVDLLFQAKGHYYSLADLMGGDEKLGECFQSGQFATIYLAPKDYHRIHMPIDGTLISTTYIPGRIFPVNGPSVRRVSGVFARNERVVCLFDTPQGKMAMILVGALFVGSIETVWQGEITPPHLSHPITYNYNKGADSDVALKKGDEMGRFNLGSTVIMLFENGFSDLDLELEQSLRFGENIS